MKFRPLAIAAALASVAVLPAAGVWADDAEDQFAIAAGHYARQRWKLAAEQFEVFLKQHSQHPKAGQGAFFLAEALLQTGDSAKAGTYFRQYLDRQPDGKFTRPALFRAGEAAYLAGEYGSAKVNLERFLAKYPRDKLNAYVLPYLGDIALGADQVDAAARYFRDGLTRFPRGRLQDDCRFGLARALETQGKNEDAGRYYLAVAAKTGSPLADDAQFHMGVLQYTTGKYEEAVKTFSAFESTFTASQWKAGARLGSGWALMKLDRLPEAGRALAGIASDPKVGIQARYWLGHVQKKQKDWAAAAKTLLEAAETAPQHELAPAIRFHAGDALLESGDAAAAAEQFDWVISLGTDAKKWLDDAMLGKLRAALALKDHQSVDQTAAGFHTQFPQSSLKNDVQRLSAKSYLQRKQYDKAAELLSPMVAVGSRDQQALADRYLLAVAYEGLKRYDDALKVLESVPDSATGRMKADAQLMHGSLLLALKRYAEAVGPLEAFLAGDPSGDAALKGRGQLAICYARSDRLDEAKKLYADICQEHPEHELVAPIVEQLAEAALEATDTAWSAKLFARLARETDSAHELKGLAGLGWSRLKGGRPAEAAETFDELLKKDPPPDQAAEAALARGRILEQLDRPDPALAMYDLVIEKYPDSRQHCHALFAAAALRDRLQQDERAAKLYEQLAEAHPKFADLDAVLYQWSWVQYDLAKADEAAALLKRLRTEFPQSRYWADATYRLAQRAFAAKDYRRAEQLVGEVLAAQSAALIRDHARYLGGQIAVAEQDWPRVRKTFEAHVEEFPDSPRRLVAEYWIAETIYRRGDHEDAGRRFDRLAQQSSGNREPWTAMIPLRRAQVLAHQKKWNEAYAVASKIQAEYPNFEQQYEVDYLIGRCLARRAEFEGARQAFNKVINSPAGKGTETEAMARWMIGETYFHQKNYEAAMRQYLALEIRCGYPTWQAGALLQAGKCRELLGEPKEAAKHYARVLKEYPDTPFTERASSRLQTVLGGRAESVRP